MNKVPTPITTLTPGLTITVILPIEQQAGLKTLPNDAAVIETVEADRSRLVFSRNGFATWADNALLLDNVDQFTLRDPDELESPLPFDYVTTWEFDKPLYLVVDCEGNEVARAISEDMAIRMAAALVTTSAAPEKVELSFNNGKVWETCDTAAEAQREFEKWADSPAVFRGLFAGPTVTSVDQVSPAIPT